MIPHPERIEIDNRKLSRSPWTKIYIILAVMAVVLFLAFGFK